MAKEEDARSVTSNSSESVLYSEPSLSPQPQLEAARSSAGSSPESQNIGELSPIFKNARLRCGGAEGSPSRAVAPKGPQDTADVQNKTPTGVCEDPKGGDCGDIERRAHKNPSPASSTPFCLDQNPSASGPRAVDSVPTLALAPTSTPTSVPSDQADHRTPVPRGTPLASPSFRISQEAWDRFKAFRAQRPSDPRSVACEVGMQAAKRKVDEIEVQESSNTPPQPAMGHPTEPSQARPVGSPPQEAQSGSSPALSPEDHPPRPSLSPTIRRPVAEYPRKTPRGPDSGPEPQHPRDAWAAPPEPVEAVARADKNGRTQGFAAAAAQGSTARTVARSRAREREREREKEKERERDERPREAWARPAARGSPEHGDFRYGPPAQTAPGYAPSSGPPAHPAQHPPYPALNARQESAHSYSHPADSRDHRRPPNSAQASPSGYRTYEGASPSSQSADPRGVVSPKPQAYFQGRPVDSIATETMQPPTSARELATLGDVERRGESIALHAAAPQEQVYRRPEHRYPDGRFVPPPASHPTVADGRGAPSHADFHATVEQQYPAHAHPSQREQGTYAENSRVYGHAAPGEAGPPSGSRVAPRTTQGSPYFAQDSRFHPQHPPHAQLPHSEELMPPQSDPHSLASHDEAFCTVCKCDAAFEMVTQIARKVDEHERVLAAHRRFLPHTNASPLPPPFPSPQQGRIATSTAPPSASLHSNRSNSMGVAEHERLGLWAWIKNNMTIELAFLGQGPWVDSVETYLRSEARRAEQAAGTRVLVHAVMGAGADYMLREYAAKPETFTKAYANQLRQEANAHLRLFREAVASIDIYNIFEAEFEFLQGLVVVTYTASHLCTEHEYLAFLGLGIRLAQRIGLHLVHGKEPGVRVDEEYKTREMARRVWWALVSQDWLAYSWAGMTSTTPSQCLVEVPEVIHDMALEEEMTHTQLKACPPNVTLLVYQASIAASVYDCYTPANWNTCDNETRFYLTFEGPCAKIGAMALNMLRGLNPSAPGLSEQGSFFASKLGFSIRLASAHAMLKLSIAFVWHSFWKENIPPSHLIATRASLLSAAQEIASLAKLYVALPGFPTEDSVRAIVGASVVLALWYYANQAEGSLDIRRKRDVERGVDQCTKWLNRRRDSSDLARAGLELMDQLQALHEPAHHYGNARDGQPAAKKSRGEPPDVMEILGPRSKNCAVWRWGLGLDSRQPIGPGRPFHWNQDPPPLAQLHYLTQT